jgi:putative methyltransferase (TIGR04325 family)
MDNSIIETQRVRWPKIVKSLKGCGPLTTAYTYVPPDNTCNDLKAHNTIMSYAYALSLASRNKNAISILDWGGGIGLYSLLSSVLFPELKIDYYCYDTPLLCSLGREFWQNATFYENSTQAFERNYDFVIASSSLQYFENWEEVLRKLAKSSRRYTYIARLPVIQRANSFVVLQRCYQNRLYGYNTEFKSWILNRQDFLKSAKNARMELIREFLDGERIFIKKAPETGAESRGFLFQTTKPQNYRN